MSSIAVLLNETELMIITKWINQIRDSRPNDPLSEAENKLVEKIIEQQKFLKYVNS